MLVQKILGVFALIVVLSLVSWAPVAQAATGVDVTPDFVVSVVAGALALALEVIPGLKKRWDVLSWEVKRGLWLIGCVVIGTTPWSLACLGAMIGIDLSSLVIVGTCSVDTLARGMQVAFMAYFASQSVHGLAVGVSHLKAQMGSEV